MQNAASLVNNLYFEPNPWSRNAILVVRKENPVERGVCLAESEYWKWGWCWLLFLAAARSKDFGLGDISQILQLTDWLRSVGWGTWLTTTMTWRRSTKLWKSWERQTGAAFVNTSAQLRLNKRRGIVKVDLVFLAAYGIILNKFIWMAFIKLWPIRCRLTEKVTKSSTLKSEPTSAEACTYLHDRKYSVVWAFVTKLITCHYNYIGRSNPDVMWSMATQ